MNLPGARQAVCRFSDTDNIGTWFPNNQLGWPAPPGLGHRAAERPVQSNFIITYQALLPLC